MRPAAAILALVVVACSGGDDGRHVRVFAASSLTDAFTDIEAAYEAEHPDVDVQLNLAGSSALREQILEGAPADVLATANEVTMATLVGAGEVDGEPIVFAGNQLTIAVSSGNPADVTELADLARPSVLVGLCAVGVPCGDLARDVLARAGVVAAVDTNEPNVRALTAKIADGELDAGLVYVTDVLGLDDVDSVRIPKEASVVAWYPIATLDGAGADADSFTSFVLSTGGRAILAEHGFGLP